MAAGQGFKTFVTGDVLTAADTNGYLMQGVWVFADSTARTAAVTSPQEGNVSFLKDTNSLEIYDGAAWVAYGSGDITGVTAGTGISGGGTSGTVTITNSMATAIDAKGDLIAGTGADTFSRLAVGTNGQVLSADSTASTGLAWIAAGGGDIYSQDFTSSGTWTRPAGVDKVLVFAVGGGGAGGGTEFGGGANVSGGGGGGEVKFEPVTVTGNVTVTIGAGGLGANSVDGGDGSDTTFGTLLTAGGGGGGAKGTTATTGRLGTGGGSGGAGINIDTAGSGGGGGGGGAGGGGGFALGFGSGTTYNNISYFQATTNRPTTRSGSGGTASGTQNTSTNYLFGGNGGAGIMGYGGGGGGGMKIYSGSNAPGTVSAGGALGKTSGNGNSASANTGGGGGGTGGNAGAAQKGGDGGSGFLRVIWVAS